MKEDLVRRLLSRRDDSLTVEVKADERAESTGNHYVELSCKGRPSGIRITQAAYWSVALPDGTVVMVPTEKVRRLADKAEEQGHVAHMDRGSHPTRGALVPLARLVA